MTVLVQSLNKIEQEARQLYRVLLYKRPAEAACCHTGLRGAAIAAGGHGALCYLTSKQGLRVMVPDVTNVATEKV